MHPLCCCICIVLPFLLPLQEQYVFLYDAILEATIAEKTSFPLETYPDYLDSICTSIVGGKTKLHRQFKVGGVLSVFPVFDWGLHLGR